MDKIGGDFYDIIELKSGVYGILVADITGHGIPAALLTFMTSAAFKNAALKRNTTAEVVAETNKQLFQKMPMGAFITMFYAIYDANTGLLQYTQAGHPPGMIIRPASNKAISLATNDGLVGVFDEDEMHFREGRINLQPGDKLLLYTDAIIETSKGDQMIGLDDFTAFLISNCACPIAELLDKIYQFGIDFSGRPSYNDDLTLVGFDVLK
jgi:serine phosphatase RsbU (regulator of sigma subunit)